MCGITAITALNGQPCITPEKLKVMNDCLTHRGPDDEGLFVNDNGTVGLSQRRLSIIDLSEAGRQPMSNEDGTVWMTFNGEIYNYKALRAELEAKGHIFNSQTDGEVVVHLYEEEGEACLRKLRGMYALVVWDSNRDEFMFAADRTGQKPIKYYSDDHVLVLASGVKPLLESGYVCAEADLSAVHQTLAMNHVRSPDTGFIGIKKLPAAHYGIVRNGKLEVKRYWEPIFTPKNDLSYEEAKEQLRAQLHEAVELRLMSDVPLGAFLSGGLDSSVVVALMSELGGTVKTFSIGFSDAAYDERAKARLVAEKFGTEHTEFEVTPDATSIMADLVRHYEEPYADSSGLPTWYLAELTRQHVTVALSGDGGDEALAGYKRHVYWNKLKWFWPQVYRAIETHFYFNPKKYRWLYTDDFISQMPAEPVYKLKNLDDVLRLGYDTFLPDDLLHKVDIATMAHSLEGRSPFLDHEFIEFAGTLPSHFKLKGSNTKRILRDAFADILPPEITVQGKQGFNLPVDEWFRGDSYEWAKEILLDEQTARRGWLKTDGIERIFKHHISGHNHGQRIWTLLCVELWAREFID